jgi:hypothetical protein
VLVVHVALLAVLRLVVVIVIVIVVVAVRHAGDLRARTGQPPLGADGPISAPMSVT